MLWWRQRPDALLERLPVPSLCSGITPDQEFTVGTVQLFWETDNFFASYLALREFIIYFSKIMQPSSMMLFCLFAPIHYRIWAKQIWTRQNTAILVFWWTVWIFEYEDECKCYYNLTLAARSGLRQQVTNSSSRWNQKWDLCRDWCWYSQLNSSDHLSYTSWAHVITPGTQRPKPAARSERSVKTRVRRKGAELGAEK